MTYQYPGLFQSPNPSSAHQQRLCPLWGVWRVRVWEQWIILWSLPVRRSFRERMMRSHLHSLVSLELQYWCSETFSIFAS